MSIRHVFRSAITGRWVKALYAKRHKRTTLEETYETPAEGK